MIRRFVSLLFGSEGAEKTAMKRDWADELVVVARKFRSETSETSYATVVVLVVVIFIVHRPLFGPLNTLAMSKPAQKRFELENLDC